MSEKTIITITLRTFSNESVANDFERIAQRILNGDYGKIDGIQIIIDVHGPAE